MLFLLDHCRGTRAGSAVQWSLSEGVDHVEPKENHLAVQNVKQDLSPNPQTYLPYTINIAIINAIIHIIL